MGEESTKQYDALMASLRFTDQPDAITNEDDKSIIRAKMSCGHAVDPNSLTAWCRSLIEKGETKFYCPAEPNSENPSELPRKCGKEWSYSEVRKLALLNDSEMEYFESKLSELAAKETTDVKECPKCRSFVERKYPKYLQAVCPVCTAKGSSYEFCWRCQRAWSGPPEATERCGNPGCEQPDLASVRDCELIQIADLTKPVPKRRACPNCGCVAEHDESGCKFVICPRCCKEYCFSCLLLKADCLRVAVDGWFNDCANGVAVKQTAIPVWIRNQETAPSESTAPLAPRRAGAAPRNTSDCALL